MMIQSVSSEVDYWELDSNNVVHTVKANTLSKSCIYFDTIWPILFNYRHSAVSSKQKGLQVAALRFCEICKVEKVNM